ncbi:MAG: hypothetical protein J6C57_02345 [Paludibacteraceae bacterium]|nr:hypothetical protein [Paludibacteraceae bacterium]
MKKIFFLAAMLLLTIAAFAETIPANDSRVTYVGRTLVEGTDVSFDWTATYFRLSFSGRSLTMRATDTKWDATPEMAATRHNYYNVWIDAPMSAEPHRIIEVASADTIIELIDPAYLKKSKIKEHQVIVQKRTEGEQGKMTIHEFATDAKGVFYQAEPIRKRQLEFIGASYDCGFGVDDTSRLAKFTPETENASRSFCAILSRYFDADYVVIAHSGMGAARNYNSKFAGYHMPDRYLQTFDMDSAQATRWNAAESDIHPAITCIYLGGNDFSVAMQPSYEKFRDGYYRLIRSIKDYYGEDHPVLCVSSKAHSTLLDYMRDMVKFCPMPNVHFMACCPTLHLSTDEDLGASMHPNYIGHQKFSYAYIPYIATITGWGLQDNPVK